MSLKWPVLWWVERKTLIQCRCEWCDTWCIHVCMMVALTGWRRLVLIGNGKLCIALLVLEGDRVGYGLAGDVWVQLSRPQTVNIPERYAPLPSEDDERNLSAEERQRKREMSERYRRMVAAQRCAFVCVGSVQWAGMSQRFWWQTPTHVTASDSY